jgi:hypothetical protein
MEYGRDDPMVVHDGHLGPLKVQRHDRLGVVDLLQDALILHLGGRVGVPPKIFMTTPSYFEKLSCSACWYFRPATY